MRRRLRPTKRVSRLTWRWHNDLLAALRDFEGGQVEERISATKRTEFLFIDDFGDRAAERGATDYARGVMFRILDHRNNYQTPTFITSNLDPRKMTGQFDERIVKRLAKLCVLVEASGQPMRELVDATLKVSRWESGAVHA